MNEEDSVVLTIQKDNIMSYNPYKLPIEPASPVPSYQASSQSGGSPSGDTFPCGSSIGTTTASPQWSTPSTPSSPFIYNGSTVDASPILTYDGSVDCEDAGVDTMKNQKVFARECRSNMKALELLEATAGTDVKSANRLSHSDDNNGVNDFKRGIVLRRECVAKTKALMLLQETSGGDVKCTSVPVDGKFSTNITINKELEDSRSPEKVNTSISPLKELDMPNLHHDDYDATLGSNNDDIESCKDDLCIAREKGANLRALALLNATVGQDVSSTTPQRQLTVRQAAELSHLIRQQKKAEYKAKVRAEQKAETASSVRLVAAVDKESLAESSRGSRRKTAEEILDPDTVAGMKCAMDIERELIAKKKALQLLNERPGCMA